MSVYSPVNPMDPLDASFIPTDRFEVGQYVRVFLGSCRYEIGQVAEIRETDIVVTSQQGYDLVVSPRNVKRAFLVVLDINGVLAARGKGTFVPRPYVNEFMRFVFSNFAVAVWTSGLERSSNPIIESVFDGFKHRLLFKLYRESCTPRATQANPWGTIKDLQLIFSRYPESFHSVNTIIIDDSPGKCSHPDIALCPIPFTDPVLQKDDDGLKKAMVVLKEVLAVDSHAPVIRAAEERLTAIRAGEHGAAEAAELAKAEACHSSSPVPNAEPLPLGGARKGDATSAPLEEITLWKSRLCCDNLRGRCAYGDECRFSHDEDDHKRPCSRKNKCTYGHVDRWIPTEGDAILEKQRRERKKFYDKTDFYFLSDKDLKEVSKPGRVRTGIPHEDARLEEEQARAAATASAGLHRDPPQVLFSTDPNRQRRAAGPTADGWHGSFEAFTAEVHRREQEPHQQEQQEQQQEHRQQRKRRGNAHSPSTFPSAERVGGAHQSGSAQHSPQGPGMSASDDGGATHSGYTVTASSTQQQSSKAGKSHGGKHHPTDRGISDTASKRSRISTGGVIHLQGSGGDGSALVRQLHNLETQKKR